MQALFSRGDSEAALELLAAGLHEEMEESARYTWVPNATIFEYLIRHLCDSGENEKARLTLNTMNVRTISLFSRASSIELLLHRVLSPLNHDHATRWPQLAHADLCCHPFPRPLYDMHD